MIILEWKCWASIFALSTTNPISAPYKNALAKLLPSFRPARLGAGAARTWASEAGGRYCNDLPQAPAKGWGRVNGLAEP